MDRRHLVVAGQKGSLSQILLFNGWILTRDSVPGLQYNALVTTSHIARPVLEAASIQLPMFFTIIPVFKRFLCPYHVPKLKLLHNHSSESSLLAF